MSDYNSTSSTGTDDSTHLTVEDSGSTADASDLVADRDAGTADASEGAEGSDTATTGRGSLGDIGHVFDQTNGVIEGLDGDSDGSADSDVRSSAERADEEPTLDEYGETDGQEGGDAEETTRTGA